MDPNYPQTPEDAFALATALPPGAVAVVGAFPGLSLADLFTPANWQTVFAEVEKAAVTARQLAPLVEPFMPAIVAQVINQVLASIPIPAVPAPTPAATT